jgi:hypothetical protein
VAPAAALAIEPADHCAGWTPLAFESLRAGKGAGQTVAVEGTPRPALECTLLACASGNPCCNQCSGGYRLLDTSAQRITLLGLPGCSGTTCAVRCEPFGQDPRQRYRFIGHHRYRRPGAESIFAKSDITVERVCVTP